MPDPEPVVGRPDLVQPILDICTDDWYGLWEILDHVAQATHAMPDAAFRDELRDQLVGMIDRGWLDAAVWSYESPRPVTADELREMPPDSELWKYPVDSTSDEQLRLAATDSGRRVYLGTSA